MVKAIFWDNDGVLVDTEPVFLKATAKVLFGIGIELTGDFYVNHVLKYNRSAFDLARKKGIPEDEVQRLRAERDRVYLELLQQGVPIIAGVKEALRALHGKVIMAVVTSSRAEHFEVIIDAHGLRPYFDFFITEEDVTEKKPSPEPYRLALARSGCPPEACLAIEDSERGVTAAKAAGLQCFAIPTALSAANDFSAADRVLKNVGELIGLLA